MTKQALYFDDLKVGDTFRGVAVMRCTTITQGRRGPSLHGQADGVPLRGLRDVSCTCLDIVGNLGTPLSSSQAFSHRPANLSYQPSWSRQARFAMQAPQPWRSQPTTTCSKEIT
jgi:hypothetical protein